MVQEKFGDTFSIHSAMSGYEKSHFREPADNHQYSIMTLRKGQTFDEIHGNGRPRPLGDREEVMGAEGLVVRGLGVVAGGAGLDVVLDCRSEFRPVEPAFDISDSLVNSWVAGEFVVVEGSEDIESCISEIRDIDESFEKEKLSISVPFPILLRNIAFVLRIHKLLPHLLGKLLFAETAFDRY